MVALKSPVGKVVRSSSAKWDEATADLPKASCTRCFSSRVLAGVEHGTALNHRAV